MGCGREKKDYDSKITVFCMYIFQWFQQNIVMAVDLLIRWDWLIFFPPHLLILMKFTEMAKPEMGGKFWISAEELNRDIPNPRDQV